MSDSSSSLAFVQCPECDRVFENQAFYRRHRNRTECVGNTALQSEATKVASTTCNMTPKTTSTAIVTDD